MIINGDYFVGELYISQAQPGASSTAANNKVEVAQFIDEYEREILEKGLGYGLMKEFYSFINPKTGGIKEDQNGTKWDKLLNGDQYVKNGETYYWQGLVVKEGIIYRSLMAYYVYFHYKTNGVTQTTTRGETKGTKGAVKKAGVSNKTVKAWRKMIDWYGIGHCNDDYYPPVVSYRNGVVFEDYFVNRHQSGKVTLFQYMTDHKEDFPNWKFTPLQNINKFDI